MCLVRCLSQHTYRIPFRGKDKMKICLDVGDKLSSLLRGMNLSMSVASSACLHIKKHRIVSSSPRTFACLHNNDAKHNSLVRFAVVRFFADRNCEFILAAERKKTLTHKKWCTRCMCGYLICDAPSVFDRRVLRSRWCAFFNSLYLFFQMESVVIFSMST